MVMIGLLSFVLIVTFNAPLVWAESAPSIVQQLWPELPPEAAKPSAIPGWQEVLLPDGTVLYVESSQRYAIIGRLVDLWTRQDLTALRLETERRNAAAAIPSTDVVWAAPSGPPRGRLYVFDDPDCPYCRRAHPLIRALTEQGIEVGILLYPLTRIHPDAYNKSVAIWCSGDRLASLDQVMSGQAVAPPDPPCDHPIDRNIALGRKIGVTGTPYWLSSRGKALSGVQPLEALLRLSEEALGPVSSSPSTRAHDTRSSDAD